MALGISSMKFGSHVTFAILMLFQLSYGAYAMECKIDSIITVSFSCPTFVDSSDKAYCCVPKQNPPYCCTLDEYIVSNTAIIAGIIASSAVLLIILVIICCCCCSCCLLAKRRQQRGTVLYGPVSSTQTVLSTYPPHTAYPQMAYPQAAYPQATYPQATYPQATYPGATVSNPPPYTDSHQPSSNPQFSGKY